MRPFVPVSRVNVLNLQELGEAGLGNAAEWLEWWRHARHANQVALTSSPRLLTGFVLCGLPPVSWDSYMLGFFFTRDDVVSQCHKLGSTFLSYFSWEAKTALFFFNFPVSRARPEKIVWFLLAATSNHVKVRLDRTSRKKDTASAKKGKVSLRYCVYREGGLLTFLLRKGGAYLRGEALIEDLR